MTDPNAECRRCEHFRNYRPLTQLLMKALKAEQSAGLLTELNRLIAAESERRDRETEIRIDAVERGRVEWPLRPMMSDHCGQLETEGTYFVHEIRNSERNCKGFKEQARSVPHKCADCHHVRTGDGWVLDARTLSETARDDTAGTAFGQPTSQLARQAFDIIEQRKLTEASQCFYGLRFHEPPRYLAHCAIFSSAEEFVPCILRNNHGRCPSFHGTAAGPPASPREEVVADKSSSPPQPEGRSMRIL